MLAPDLLYHDRIRTALNDLRARPNVLDQVFRGVSSETMTTIKAWVGATDIAVRLGWTQTVTTFPCIAVVAVSEQEGQQFIGSSFGGTDGTSFFIGDDDSLEEDQATQVTGAIDCAIHDTNATVVSWLTAIVKWIVLRHRVHFEDLGLVEQRVSVTDFMPATEYPQPDPAYTRAVKVQYTTYVTYTTVDETHTPVQAADHIIVRDLSDG